MRHVQLVFAGCYPVEHQYINTGFQIWFIWLKTNNPLKNDIEPHRGSFSIPCAPIDIVGERETRL